MKVTIDVNEELQHAMQLHLDGGPRVDSYVRAALRFFRDMYNQEATGKVKIGFGDKARFNSYNTEASPANYLQTEKERE